MSIRPGSGYDIKKFCDSSIAHFWNENYGHIYPVLKQLELDGWVEKTTEINENKLRNIFSITELGNQKLVEWLSLSPAAPQARYEFLLKMFFSHHISSDVVIQRLEESIEICKKMKQSYMDVEKSTKEKLPYNEGCVSGATYRYLTLRFGILSVDSTIRWCEESIELIKSLKKEEEKV